MLVVVVGCNQKQIDATVVEGRALVVGAERVLADGSVELAAGFTQAVRVSRDGKVTVIGTTRAPRKPATRALEVARPAMDFLAGHAGVQGHANMDRAFRFSDHVKNFEVYMLTARARMSGQADILSQIEMGDTSEPAGSSRYDVTQDFSAPTRSHQARAQHCLRELV